MENYTYETYGDRIAGIYDQLYQEVDETALEMLAEFAGSGPVLELGIGTGRVALPLLKAGIDIRGIDASQAMLDELQSKPDGNRIPVTLGNFADMAVEGQFDLIFVVFNTFFCLLTQDEQVKCFENVAKHLSPEGHFLLETFVPDTNRSNALRVINVDDGVVRMDANMLDTVTQIISAQQIFLTDQGIRFYPVKIRFVWPSELDLMARLAGLQLHQRWEDWKRTPFSRNSKKVISVYCHHK